LQKRAREAIPQELIDFKDNLEPFYLYPEQMVFVDETSKDSRAALRRYAWAPRGAPAIVDLPFTRGKRVSALAAYNFNGFFAWAFTQETFTRISFHRAFVEKILPHLNPWPMPNSIVVMDNARIHMYSELEDAINSRGAYLFFLPPYCPQLNPIEIGFGRLKSWIQKEAHLLFKDFPEEALDAAFRLCITTRDAPVNTFAHCGYGAVSLIDEKFDLTK